MWLSGGTCRLCGDPAAQGQGADLCAGCLADLPRNHHACDACGLPLSGNGSQVCSRCQQHPPPWDAPITPFVYASPIDYFIRRLKFAEDLSAAGLLAALARPALCSLAPDLLIPVPLHASRLRRRGFNQAQQIARPLGRQLGITVDAHSCRRIIATPEQSRLSARARRRNLRGAFECRRDLQGLHVAVVDDVMTTGSTTAEFSRVLRKAGARRISICCIARVPPFSQA